MAKEFINAEQVQVGDVLWIGEELTLTVEEIVSGLTRIAVVYRDVNNTEQVQMLYGHVPYLRLAQAPKV